MAYSIPITIALVCLASLFLFLGKVFDKERKHIKTLFVMLTLGTVILIAQVIKIIIEANVTGDTLVKLSSMATSVLTISIVLFSFFIMYYLVMYTKDAFVNLRNARTRRENA